MGAWATDRKHTAVEKVPNTRANINTNPIGRDAASGHGAKGKETYEPPPTYDNPKTQCVYPLSLTLPLTQWS